jgi:hypothetical protein
MSSIELRELQPTASEGFDLNGVGLDGNERILLTLEILAC